MSAASTDQDYMYWPAVRQPFLGYRQANDDHDKGQAEAQAEAGDQITTQVWQGRQRRHASRAADGRGGALAAR